jgi:hypothetical protein
MDILWPAMGISVIVGFVFYVLAGHWGRVLRQQAGVIRHLSDRVQMIEEVDSPRFRERLNESAPAPLEQVFTFTFRFGEQFWRHTLGLTKDDWDFVRGFGAFVGSVKLERWRSHTAAIITEVLPNRKTAAWQTRSLYSYPGPSGRSDRLTLWELPLARPAFGQKPQTLELAMDGDAIELSAKFAAASDLLSDQLTGKGFESVEETFFRVPLDTQALSEFRGEDPAETTDGNGSSNGHGATAGSWRAFYAREDAERGIEWQLRVIDLNRKTDWDRWKILESTAPQVSSRS